MAMKNYPALSDFKPPLGQQMSGLKKNLSFRCLKNYFLAAILIFIATRIHYQIGLAMNHFFGRHTTYRGLALIILQLWYK